LDCGKPRFGDRPGNVDYSFGVQADRARTQKLDNPRAKTTPAAWGSDDEGSIQTETPGLLRHTREGTCAEDDALCGRVMDESGRHRVRAG
jgi:hypothetical protein